MTDLFAGNDDQPSLDPNKNYFDELVGEGKKYKTAAELAYSKAHADMTIALRNRELDQLRADYLKEKEMNTTGETLKAFMDQLKANPGSSSYQNPPANEAPPTFDPKQLETLLDTKLYEREAMRKQEDNYKTVEGKLIEHYGTDYKNVLNKQMVDLGLTPEDINNMARKQPQVFIRTFGLDRKPSSETFQTPMESNLGFAPLTGPKRTWTFYQELRKNQPTVYHNQKTQQQMMADYARLGTAFEDGNFHQYN